jgi:hypothetical protein
MNTGKVGAKDVFSAAGRDALGPNARPRPAHRRLLAALLRPGRRALRQAVPAPRNIDVIRILQFAPVFGSIYDMYIPRSRYMDTMWAATRDVPLSVLISPPPAGTFGCYPQIPNDRPANGCHPSYLTPMALLQSARAFSDASAALANDTTSSTSSFRGRVERAWMGVENPPVSHSMLQMILLPRQARDNHGEKKLRKYDVFVLQRISTRCCGAGTNCGRTQGQSRWSGPCRAISRTYSIPLDGSIIQRGRVACRVGAACVI